MFSIGEFSKITGLSIKALRLYHEQGILVPTAINQDSHYRYYDQANMDRARAIALLRHMMFSLDDIKEILKQSEDDTDTLSFLATHRNRIEEKIRDMKKVRDSLSKLIEDEEKARQFLSNSPYKVEEKTLPAILIAGIRVKGSYHDSGKAFATLGKSMGRLICGKAMNLFYDSEYKERDAEFESCFPVRVVRPPDGVGCRELEGGKAVSLIHRGPYTTLGRSYARIFSHIRNRGYESLSPSREVYVKGPGMIFKGNTRRYLTEIQLLVRS
jgi:DNA-binding transcriptional MerR regulator/DNA gyrase inhibitor GyrI